MKPELTYEEHVSLINETVESISYHLETDEGHERVKTLMWELNVKALLDFAKEDEETITQLGEPEYDRYSHHHPNNQ